MDTVIGYQLRTECVKAKTLTKEENLELVRQIQAGNKEAINKYVICNGKLVIKVIKDKFPYYIESEDVFQAGLIGLLKAAEMYETDSEASVATYAYDWIRQSIGRYITNCESTVRIPVHTNEKLIKIKQAVYKYDSEDTKQDKLEFIQEHTGFDSKLINELLPYVDSSISLNSMVESDSDTVGEIIDLIADESESIESRIENKDVSERLHKVLKEALNDKEYTIIMNRFGFFGEEKTFDEITTLVGIKSRQGIQQCEARALKKLQQPKYEKILRELYR